MSGQLRNVKSFQKRENVIRKKFGKNVWRPVVDVKMKKVNISKKKLQFEFLKEIFYLKTCRHIAFTIIYMSK